MNSKDKFDWKDIPRDVRLAVLRSPRSLSMAESLVKALKLTDGGAEACLQEQCSRLAYENGKLSSEVEDLERRLKGASVALSDDETAAIQEAGEILAKVDGNWLYRYKASEAAAKLFEIVRNKTRGG